MASDIPFAWLRYAKTDSEKEAIRLLIRNNSRVNDLVLRVLSDLYDSIEHRGDKEEDYKEAGILALLAFRNGQKAALKEIAKLFTLDQKEKK